MRRRAEQRSQSCPWCSGVLDIDAAECPGCWLPLTMAAVDIGRPPSSAPQGTSSTATSSQPQAHISSFHRRSDAAHPNRARFFTWLLAGTAVLLLVAGLASLFSLKDPVLTADGAARVSLWRRWRTEVGVPPPPLPAGAVDAVEVPGDRASTAATEVSTVIVDSMWFGAARSSTGTCHVFGAKLDPKALRFLGTLGADEPCTGDEARLRLEKRLRAD